MWQKYLIQYSVSNNFNPKENKAVAFHWRFPAFDLYGRGNRRKYILILKEELPQEELGGWSQVDKTSFARLHVLSDFYAH